MVQKRETKAINKLCVRETLSLSFVCGAYIFEFRGRNLVCFGIATGEDNKKIMFTTVNLSTFIFSYMDKAKQKYNLVAR